MSKRFRAIKQEFKKHGCNLTNLDVRFYLHRRERQVKMMQRFLRDKWKIRSITDG